MIDAKRRLAYAWPMRKIAGMASAFAIVCSAISACGSEGGSASPSEPPPSTDAAAIAPVATFKHQRADEPIENLVASGSHCFDASAEAVAAQLRAAAWVEKDNAEKRRALDEKGILMPYGYPFYVGDVERTDNETCYIVDDSGLL